MKCIRTRYLPPTHTKGARIRADDGDGNQITLSRHAYGTIEEGMGAAARALCAKMHWAGKLAPGSYGEDTYWCFVG